ncbi:MAG: hypothetical protein IJM15_04515, partial [Erysipelotrichaceae bacterium]|nr:hypothetical protein [Erysipelotrichaceae bacterium]
FLQSAGTVNVKNLQLEEGCVANRYSLIENGNFENDFSYWTKSNLTADDVLTTSQSGQGYYVLSSVSTAKKLSQTISISGNQNDYFVINCWGKVESTVMESLNSAMNSENARERNVGVRLVFIKSDNSEESETVRFDSVSTNWQYLSAGISAPVNYVSVRVELISEYCKGTVIFDDAELFLESFGTMYQYDSDGRIISVQDSQGNITNTVYKTITVTNDDNSTESRVVVDYDEYLKTTDPSYEKRISYDYDVKGNVISETYTDYSLDTSDPNRVVTVIYNYDEDNNLVSTEINGNIHYESGEVTYSENYASSYSDERGMTTSFNYDEVTGHLLSSIDPDNNTTSYTYITGTDLTSSVSSSNSSVNYTYDSLGQISTISHSNTSGTSTQYSFEYDSFGNIIEVSVGNRVLYSYEYESHNGKLYSTTNGNNEQTSYRYDSLDRVTQIYQGNTLAYSFDYSTDGKLGRFTDHLYNETETYEYDFSGNIISESRSDGTSLFNDYDDNGKIISSGYSKLTNSSITSFSYDNRQQIESINWNTNNSFSSLLYNRDYLGRYTESIYKINNSNILVTDVNYLTVTENNETKTTGFIAGVTNSFGTDQMNYQYQYDDNGNIEMISVTRGNTLYTINYHYDSLNQLIREDDEILDRTTVYEYDSGGNITSINRYAYTAPNSAVSTPTLTRTFGYTDSNWKDLLTTYNGNTITYDSAGYPLSYFDGKVFTWSDGKLMGYTDSANNTSASYTYNSEGIRTSKTVNGVTTEYVVSGTTILQEKRGSRNIVYEYDDNGSLRSFVYNGNRYIYVKDGTEDIVGIIDSSGSLVARYDYDGFGNCRVTNLTDGKIGTINPFRYRSYYHDNDSGLEYLNSRYYDRRTGRFISPDDVEYLGAGGKVLSYNLFTYCENNPVNKEDKDGHYSLSNIAFWFGFIIGYLIGRDVARKIGVYGIKSYAISIISSFITAFLAKTITRRIVIKLTSKALFDGRIATSTVSVIQLLKKFYETPKTVAGINAFLKIKMLCEEYGIKISYKINDIINVVNHKSWDGIPHVHIGNSRIHIAIAQEVFRLLRWLLK